jgi:hypothetical protein
MIRFTFQFWHAHFVCLWEQTVEAFKEWLRALRKRRKRQRGEAEAEHFEPWP